MNERDFNHELNKLTRDLKLLFNHERKLWGVYQVRASHIIGVGPADVRPWLLFDIETDGHFRLPDNRDLIRVIKSRNSKIELERIGSKRYLGKIEDQEQARRGKTDAKTEDTIKQATKAAARSIRREGKIYR